MFSEPLLFYVLTKRTVNPVHAYFLFLIKRQVLCQCISMFKVTVAYCNVERDDVPNFTLVES